MILSAASAVLVEPMVADARGIPGLVSGEVGELRPGVRVDTGGSDGLVIERGLVKGVFVGAGDIVLRAHPTANSAHAMQIAKIRVIFLDKVCSPPLHISCTAEANSKHPYS